MNKDFFYVIFFAPGAYFKGSRCYWIACSKPEVTPAPRMTGDYEYGARKNITNLTPTSFNDIIDKNNLTADSPGPKVTSATC